MLLEHCKDKYGFAGLKSVHDSKNNLLKEQPTHFTAKLMKYLFLIDGPDTLLSQTEYTITPTGHILKIGA
jgi:hypothetical protein